MVFQKRKFFISKERSKKSEVLAKYMDENPKFCITRKVEKEFLYQRKNPDAISLGLSSEQKVNNHKASIRW